MPRPFEGARLLIGFLVLPLINALTAFAAHLAVWPRAFRQDAWSGWSDPFDTAAFFASGVFIMAVLATVLGAVPVVTWLVHTRRVTFKSVLVSAIAVGNSPYLVAVVGTFVLFLAGPASWSDVRYVIVDGPLGLMRAVAIGSGLGAVSGLSFWFVAIAGSRVGRASKEKDSGYEV